MRSFICAVAVAILIVPSHGQDAHKFSVGLYKAIAKTNEPGKNIALSPFSADAALSMTYVGAGGATKSELGSTLGIGHGVTTAQLAKKFKQVNAVSDGYTLQSANAIFLEKTYAILPAYRGVVTNDFGANITSVDFQHKVEAARVQINTFAAEKTNNKIRDLIAPGDLSPQTKLVLVNAVYFKADWAVKFKEYMTSPKPFTLADGQDKTASLMNVASNFGYADSAELGGAQIVELKFKMGETSMVFILPKKETGLQGLENILTPASLETALNQLASERVSVYLPKFKVETTYKLESPLQGMGIKTAFSSSADFSGISASPVAISKVIQKVFVNVNEEGAEAAAATVIRAMPTSGFFSMTKPKEFRADHPFLYLIRHNPSKAILFIGRVSDPTVEN